MKTDKPKLSLGAIPNPDAVKVSITLSSELKKRLDAYAETHASVYGTPADAVTLIPFMLEAFIARDRGFKAITRKVAR